MCLLLQICPRLPGLRYEEQRMQQIGSPATLHHIRQQIESIEEHQRLTMHQHAAYVKARASLAPKHALVTIDFTKMALPDTMEVMVAFVFVIEFVKDQNVVRQYVDLLATSDKADVHFVISGIRYLLESTPVLSPFSFLHFWSDGSVHQFKNRFVQRFISCIAPLYQKVATYDYFTAHHGKSLTDSHAYHLKRAATQLFLNHEKEANQLQQLGLAGGFSSDPGTAHFSLNLSHVKAYIESKVGHTTAFLMLPIARFNFWKEHCSKIIGIKKMHSFSYLAVGEPGIIWVVIVPSTQTGGSRLPWVANRISLFPTST
jgi:hypothetical protein